MIFLRLKRLMINRMGKTMNIQFTDNSKEVSDNIKAALLRGLETCGLVGVLQYMPHELVGHYFVEV